MIVYTKHNNINKQKWDDCIRNSSNSSIYAYSWYLDAIYKNWSALVFNDYEAVFPLATKSKYGISYIYQPFFSRYFGVFTNTNASVQLNNDFFNSIPKEFKYIEINIDEHTEITLSDYQKKERHYQLLDLNESYDVLYKGFSENAKRNIKKAAKAGLVVNTGIAPETIVKLFRENKGGELKTLQPHDFENLLYLMNTAITKNVAETIVVYDKDNNVCAAGFFMKNHNRFTFLKSGVTDGGKSQGAMHLMFHFFIKKYAGTPFLLDFGGSSVESVARFYKNFGAKDCVYLQLKKNNLSRLAKLLSNKK